MYRILFITLVGVTPFCQAQTASSGSSLESRSVISTTPSEILRDPENLMHIWVSAPVPIEHYNQHELRMQEEMNNKVAESILTFSSSNPKQEWHDYDYMDITPYTWKWIDLKMVHEDSSITFMSLRRPNSWILEKNAMPGNNVYFNWEEVGAEGWAEVKRIRPNQLDTRLWKPEPKGDFISRPIIGKFEHTSSSVYDLSVDNKEAVGVTGTHPIWSADRNEWVRAAELKIGEHVQTQSGTVQVSKLKPREGIHTVYNIEVYRSHNYFSSANKLLAHNGPICNIGTRSVRDVVGDPTVTIGGQSVEILPGTSTKARASLAEYYAEKMANGNFDYSKMTDPITGQQAKIVIHRYTNGKVEIQEGHTRFIASRLAGKPISWDDPNIVEIIDVDQALGNAPGWGQAVWDRGASAERQFRMMKANWGD